MFYAGTNGGFARSIGSASESAPTKPILTMVLKSLLTDGR
jgi:hypothetical protein